jgi:type VI secretion system Hcp family effector
MDTGVSPFAHVSPVGANGDLPTGADPRQRLVREGELITPKRLTTPTLSRVVRPRGTLTINGARQGLFKGDAREPGTEPAGKMIVVDFAYELELSYDPASGAATGKQRHLPLRVTKAVGPSSPMMFSALVTNERLPSVAIELFDAPGRPGGYSIRLRNALITRIRQYMGPSASVDPNPPLLEEVSFIFQGIEVESRVGATVATDSRTESPLRSEQLLDESGSDPYQTSETCECNGQCAAAWLTDQSGRDQLDESADRGEDQLDEGLYFALEMDALDPYVGEEIDTERADVLDEFALGIDFDEGSWDQETTWPAYESSPPAALTQPGLIDHLSSAAAVSGNPYIRWVQQALNRVLNDTLALDGVVGNQTRNAIRNFQRRAGLAVDGVVGGRTEAALASASGLQPPDSAEGSSPETTRQGGSVPLGAAGYQKGIDGLLSAIMKARAALPFKIPKDRLALLRRIEYWEIELRRLRHLLALSRGSSPQAYERSLGPHDPSETLSASAGSWERAYEFDEEIDEESDFGEETYAKSSDVGGEEFYEGPYVGEELDAEGPYVSDEELYDEGSARETVF